MIITTTGAIDVSKDAPIVYRGEFKKIIPQLTADGYKAVELHIFDSKEIDRKELWALLRQYDVRLTSIGTGSIYSRKHLNLADSDPAVRASAIAHLVEHMCTAAPYHGIVIIGLIAGRFSDCSSPEEFQKNLTESLYCLDALAEKHDVYLGFELMNRFESDCLRTIDEGVSFLRDNQYKRVVLHIDTVHMNIEERDIRRAILAGKGYIGHVHIADNDRCYPGHAHYDFRETLQALKDIGYKGALALETKMYPCTEIAAAKSLQYLNALLNNLE